MTKVSLNSQTLSDHADALDGIAAFYQSILDQVPQGGQQVVNAIEVTGAHHVDAIAYQQWINGNYRTDLQLQITYLRSQAQDFRDLAAQVIADENDFS